MYYNKLILILAICLCFSSLSISQVTSGFSHNVRIDTGGNVLRELQKGLKEHYITDNSGTNFSSNYLFKDIDLSVYELLAANLSFSEKDQIQKINFQPLKLLNTTSAFLQSFKINIVQKKDITTFGFGIGSDNSLPTSEKSNRIRKQVFDFSGIKPPPPPVVDLAQFKDRRDQINQLKIDASMRNFLLKGVDKDEESSRNAVFEDYNKNVLGTYKDILDSLLLVFDESRARNVFKWTVGYNSQLFSILGAKGNTNGFDTVNYYATKADVISGTVTYSFDRGWAMLSGGYNYIQSRKNATKGIDKIAYDGYSITGSKRLIKFIPEDKLKKHPAYIKSLFIPSVNVGTIWELKTTNEQNYVMIEDGLKRVRTITPFIDILLAPAAQFRISMPIQKNTLVDGSKQIFLGANVQYSLKFSNLN